MIVRIDVAPGELIDKITILQIKAERIKDQKQLVNVRRELKDLSAARDSHLPDTADLRRLAEALRRTNEELWDVEDRLRERERLERWDAGFIELARSVYLKNDERARLKSEINTLLDSEITEEKSYAAY